LTALAALGLRQIAERGRRRDFIVAGVLIGLATGANYPAAFLGVAYVGAAMLARRRSSFPDLVPSFVLGGIAAVAAFVLTNPYVLLAPRAAWEGFTFQLGFAVKQHPYTADVPRWFYLHVLRDQDAVFAVLAACSGVWLGVRGHGFRRILGIFPWLFIGTFVAVSTQADRYILIAMPWLCTAIGVFIVDASAGVRSASGRAAIAPAALVLVALMTVGLWRRASPLVLVDAAEENPRWPMQRWLIEHAPAGGTIWLESDVLPLLQATFADPGGDLQVLVQRAFLKAHPGFRARFLKGELVERSANFDPALITARQVDLVLTCDRNVRYVEDSRPEHAAQRAFYAAVAEHGTRRFEGMGCWIAEIR
jgi:hypothetical protein